MTMLLSLKDILGQSIGHFTLENYSRSLVGRESSL